MERSVDVRTRIDLEFATSSSDAFRQEYFDSSATTSSPSDVSPSVADADDVVIVIRDPYPQLKPTWPFKSKNIEQPRQNLLSEFQQATPDRNRQSEFMRAMNKFEIRAMNQRLDEKEVADTYAKIALMVGASQSRLPLPERLSIAQQFIQQAADPSLIHQVDTTCTVGALENRITTRRPSVVADIIAQSVTTGQLKSTNGKAMAVDNALIASRIDVDPEGAVSESHSIRSQASQIFQNVVLADVAQHQGARFEFRAGKTMADYGDFWINPNGEVNKFIGLYPHELLDASERLLGKEEPFFVADKRINVARGKEPVVQVASDNRVIGIQNVSDFEAAMRRMKENGQFPGILLVNADGEPIRDPHPALKDSIVPHTVAVKDYDPAGRRVYIDNQMGTKTDRSDRWVPIDQLVANMFMGLGA